MKTYPSVFDENAEGCLRDATCEEQTMLDILDAMRAIIINAPDSSNRRVILTDYGCDIMIKLHKILDVAVC